MPAFMVFFIPVCNKSLTAESANIWFIPRVCFDMVGQRSAMSKYLHTRPIRTLVLPYTLGHKLVFKRWLVIMDLRYWFSRSWFHRFMTFELSLDLLECWLVVSLLRHVRVKFDLHRLYYALFIELFDLLLSLDERIPLDLFQRHGLV